MSSIEVNGIRIYHEERGRGPAVLFVPGDLHAAISGSALAILQDTAHVCNIEAPDAFNQAVRDVLRGRRG
jgi:hypothetical protein